MCKCTYLCIWLWKKCLSVFKERGIWDCFLSSPVLVPVSLSECLSVELIFIVCGYMYARAYAYVLVCVFVGLYVSVWLLSTRVYECFCTYCDLASGCLCILLISSEANRVSSQSNKRTHIVNWRILSLTTTNNSLKLNAQDNPNILRFL